MTHEMLFDSDENADVGVGVVLTLRPRTVIVEERFDAVGEFGCLLSIDMNDQSRAICTLSADECQYCLS